jgi:hypothetical protein
MSMLKVCLSVSLSAYFPYFEKCIKEAYKITLLSLCLCTPCLIFLIFCAVRVASKENRQSVLARTFCFYSFCSKDHFNAILLLQQRKNFLQHDVTGNNGPIYMKIKVTNQFICSELFYLSPVKSAERFGK